MKKVLSVLMVILMLAAMSVSAFADYSTSSMTANSIPEIVPKKDEDGKQATIEVEKEGGETVREAVIAIVKTPDLNTELDLVPVSKLTLTPYKDTQDAEKVAVMEAKIKENLEEAYADLNEAQKVGSIASINQDAEARKDLNAELTKRAKKVDETYTAENYQSAFLYDLQVTQNYIDYLNAGNVLEIVYQYNWKPGDVILFKCDDADEWEIIPEENIVPRDDGTIVVRVNKLCVFSVMTLSADAPAATSSALALYLLIGLGALLLLAIILLIIFAKKKKKEKEAALQGKFPWWIIPVIGAGIFVASKAFKKKK